MPTSRVQSRPTIAWAPALEAQVRRKIGATAREPRQDRARLRADLADALGLDGGVLLDRLLELGVTPDTALAFQALPLVEVAWADGRVDADERWRVLCAAAASGLELGRPAHAQLELWLARRPAQELFDAWHAFARSGPKRRQESARIRRVLGEARAVAAAAGGVLGYGAVSAPERAAVARIRDALGWEEQVRVD